MKSNPESSVKWGKSFVNGFVGVLAIGSGAMNSSTLPGTNGKNGAALASKELKGVMFYFEPKLLRRLHPQ